MSDHIKGNWFVSIFKMARMSREELAAIANNHGYRETTRRNAWLILEQRRYTY